MKIYKIFLIFFTSIIFLSDAYIVYAVDNSVNCSTAVSDYSLSSKLYPLIQCGGINANGSPQHCCDFKEATILIDRIISWFISISASVAAITFSIAGAKILLNPGNVEVRSQSIDMFKKTVIGMLIILGAWLLIHTLITTFVTNPNSALRFFAK
jgi:hypothetical protein